MRWSRAALLARLLAERYPTVEQLEVEALQPVPRKPLPCGRAVDSNVQKRRSRRSVARVAPDELRDSA